MFETTNTKLAAALLTVGFQLDCNTNFAGNQVVLCIRGGREFGYEPEEFQALWQDRAWQEHNDHHPFHHIVQVAEARDWLLNRVIFHYDNGHEPPVGDTFATDQLGLAACIVAEGYYLSFFDGRTFYFAPDAEMIRDRYIRADSDDTMKWQVSYLRVLKFLLDRIRNRSMKKACYKGAGAVAFSQ